MSRFKSVEEIKTVSLLSGHHWFSPSTMRFFGSKVYGDLVHGCYFISSEDNYDKTGRQFTLREALPDATINTVGEFGGFATLAQARKALKALEAPIT